MRSNLFFLFFFVNMQWFYDFCHKKKWQRSETLKGTILTTSNTHHHHPQPTPLVLWSRPWSPEGPHSQRLTPDASSTSECFAQPVNPPVPPLPSSSFLGTCFVHLCPLSTEDINDIITPLPIDSGAQNNLPSLRQALRIFPGRGSHQTVPTSVLSSFPHLLCPQSWGQWRSLLYSRASWSRGRNPGCGHGKGRMKASRWLVLSFSSQVLTARYCSSQQKQAQFGSETNESFNCLIKELSTTNSFAIWLYRSWILCCCSCWPFHERLESPSWVQGPGHSFT